MLHKQIVRDKCTRRIVPEGGCKPLKCLLVVCRELAARHVCVRRSWTLAAAFAFNLVAIACGGSSAAPEHPRPKSTQTLYIEADRTIITPTEALSAGQLFERGREHLLAGRAPQAAADFDKVIQLDPKGAWTEEALFHSARAHEEAGEHQNSARRFEQLARRYPTGEFARAALLRAIRLLVYGEQWQAAAELSERLLSTYEKLSPSERIVAFSSRALGYVAAKDLENAEYFIGKGRQVVEQHQLDAAGAIPRDLAQLYFALGELRRIRGERIDFASLKDFANNFEERARLLLDAQSAYSDTMRAHDAHWTAMAGYRVGELYGRLHKDVMAMPRPPGADTEKRKLLFEGAMRLRYAILLSKGLDMFAHTLSMAERTGEQSIWVERTKVAQKELKRAVEDEQRAIDALPFTREEMQRVLDDIDRRQR